MEVHLEIVKIGVNSGHNSVKDGKTTFGNGKSDIKQEGAQERLQEVCFQWNC